MFATRHYRIAGRVQGVGFRAATCDTARSLGLAGWVRNCDNGEVELAAGGTTAAIAELRSWLEHGPAAAQVSQVSEQQVETNDLPEPFRIV